MPAGRMWLPQGFRNIAKLQEYTVIELFSMTLGPDTQIIFVFLNYCQEIKALRAALQWPQSRSTRKIPFKGPKEDHRP